jgi:hypothetical protein
MRGNMEKLSFEVAQAQHGGRIAAGLREDV